MMTCRDVSLELMGLLEGDVDRTTRDRFRAHVDECSACKSYVATYRECVALARGAHADDPERSALPEHLVRSIARHVRDSRAELWNLLAAVAASPLLFFYFGGK